MYKLTLERAIADGLTPANLRFCAHANDNKGPRRKLQADHLRELANELAAYYRQQKKRRAAKQWSSQ